MDIIRFCERADHNAVLLVIVVHFNDFVSIEVDLTDRSTRRGIDTGSQDFRLLQGSRVELRVEQGIDLFGGDALDSFFLGDQAFVDHLDSDLHSGVGSAFAVAGLEHPQFTVFDGEFHILHIAVVVFKFLGDIHELVVDVFHDVLHGFEFFSVADTGNNIFTLGVQQVFTINLVFTVDRVAGERNAGTGIVTHVTEDHGHDVDSGAEVIRDAFFFTIGNSAGAVPGAEDSDGGQTHLFERIGREVKTLFFLDDGFEDVFQFLQVGSGHFGVELVALGGFEFIHRTFESFIRDLQNDGTEHLDQTAIGVINETFVAGQFDHAGSGFIIQTDVQDGVHHARHGEFRAGAAGNQERVRRITEFLSGLFFNFGQCGHHLVPKTFRKFAVC